MSIVDRARLRWRAFGAPALKRYAAWLRSLCFIQYADVHPDETTPRVTLKTVPQGWKSPPEHNYLLAYNNNIKHHRGSPRRPERPGSASRGAPFASRGASAYPTRPQCRIDTDLARNRCLEIPTDRRARPRKSVVTSTPECAGGLFAIHHRSGSAPAPAASLAPVVGGRGNRPTWVRT